MPPQTQFVGNLRENYELWYKGMEEQWQTLEENNPTMKKLTGGEWGLAHASLALTPPQTSAYSVTAAAWAVSLPEDFGCC